MDDMYCNGCGQRLVPEPTGAPCQPCPICGSTSRNSSRSIGTSIPTSDKTAASTLRDNQPIGFTESRDPELTRIASLNPSGTIRLSLLGLSPRHEEDSDIACKTLVTALTTAGLYVQFQGRGEQDDDFVLTVNSSQIGVQVVRALTDPRFWTQLARSGEVNELNLTLNEAVSALRTAIEHKTRIPPEQRSSLILLLDAYRLPALVLGPVTNEFKQVHAAWAKSLGFYQIYVVGPETTFVAQLDELLSN